MRGYNAQSLTLALAATHPPRSIAGQCPPRSCQRQPQLSRTGFRRCVSGQTERVLSDMAESCVSTRGLRANVSGSVVEPVEQTLCDLGGTQRMSSSIAHGPSSRCYCGSNRLTPPFSNPMARELSGIKLPLLARRVRHLRAVTRKRTPSSNFRHLIQPLSPPRTRTRSHAWPMLAGIQP